MKLYCLSSDASKPCFVLSFKELLIMLDCGLSAHPVLSFLPLAPVPSARLQALPGYTPPHRPDPALDGELKECCGRVFVDSVPEFCPPLDKVVDFSQLDVILISNYTCMLALPFITEDTGFKGQVLATEPTLQIARFYLEELAAWLGGAGAAAAARRWKELLHVLPPPLAHAARPRGWRRLLAPGAVARSLARVRRVGYDERVDVYGALDATPVSSGFCLGSANWVLRSAHEKVAYVSGSSTLTTHPRPINQAALRGADLLILAALTQTPAHNPDHMLGDLCVHAAVTLRGGGSVLCPVYPSGVLYDLLECLSAHLEGAGLAHVPLYVVGPVAEASLAYSNILAEWVSAGKQARVYLPEEPFPHAALARASRLRHATSLHDDAFSADFRQPCVVFCGHPSLRFGAAVHLVELWGSSPQHAIIFTEPDFPHAEALAPFQPLQMKAFHCPIDTSLNYSQANKLVRELRPRELALPEQYAAAGAGPPRPAVGGDVPTVLVRRGAARRVGARRRAARGALCGRLAAGGAGGAAGAGAPRELRPGGPRAAPLAAALRLRDNRLELLTPPPLPGAAPDAAPPAVAWGAVDRAALLRELARAGLGEARVEAGAGDAAILHLPAVDALLHLEPAATHVFCDARPHVRRKLRDALAAALPHL
ncbi:integrator complex subunit 9 [Pectinophora gossypiella]|uniref:integrator complex subunit 9 n=1 Tax=Pectinophora gossypiella TaxID=13191 RepID=UPI00214ED164|nr:integrator complex subunit 9 [Pectinophora gossypiella]